LSLLSVDDSKWRIVWAALAEHSDSISGCSDQVWTAHLAFPLHRTWRSHGFPLHVASSLSLLAGTTTSICLLACYFGLDRKSEDYAMIHHCHDCPYQRRCNTPSSTIFSPFSDTRSMVFGFHQKWVRYAIDGIGRGIH